MRPQPQRQPGQKPCRPRRIRPFPTTARSRCAACAAPSRPSRPAPAEHAPRTARRCLRPSEEAQFPRCASITATGSAGARTARPASSAVSSRRQPLSLSFPNGIFIESGRRSAAAGRGSQRRVRLAALSRSAVSGAAAAAAAAWMKSVMSSEGSARRGARKADGVRQRASAPGEAGRQMPPRSAILTRRSLTARSTRAAAPGMSAAAEALAESSGSRSA